MRFFYCILFMLFCPCVFCQNLSEKYTVSGYVKDSETGELLIGANVFIKELKTGTISNLYGFYSLTLEKGDYTLVFQYFGYQQQEIPIHLERSQTVDISSATQAQEQEAVTVIGTRQKENIENTEMGTIDVEVKKIKNLPVLLGEVDILKTLQLMPGIKSGGEGNTGLYVRGGGADQNLVLIDEAPVYNTGHLFGFFSIFNADAIKNVTVHKGNLPAHYGGRLSSVLDFSMKEGNNKTYHAEGGIGIVASRLMFEGPIVKEKGSFMISGRRTYMDAVTAGFHLLANSIPKLPYYFYDLNMKANYRLSKKDRLYLSSYLGRDQVTLNLFDGRFNSEIFWGNRTFTLRWNHLINDKLFMNVSMFHNAYIFSTHSTFDQFSSKIASKIIDYSLKADFDYYPSIRSKIKFGALYTFHTFTPRRTEANAGNVDFNENAINLDKYAHDLAFYLSDEYDITEKITLNAGVRFNIFQQIGPYKYISENNDTTNFNKGEAVKTYFNPEPRFGIRYTLNEKSSFKGGFNLNNQYIHLISLSGNSLPFDIWVSSSRLIKPQRGLQYSLGYFRNFKENSYEFSIEGYYKNMSNQIEYRQDYIPKVSGDLEADFVFGKGQSYGVEFFLKKSIGKTHGWVGYTLSRTTRKFPDINDGEVFPARYDRRHDISVVATHQLNDKWILGGTFVFGTGQAITIPERRYVIGGTVYNQYSARNGYRMQPYNRLDISATYDKKKPNRKFESSWTFAIYNAYNRKNPFIYFIDTQGDLAQNSFDVQSKKLYLFPILPSVTWNFKY